MEEKDDFDIFIEKAEQVVRLHAAGYDVENENEQLRKHALLIDPSTVPATSVEPILISKIVSNYTKSVVSLNNDSRKRHAIRKHSSINNNNINTSNSSTETGTVSPFILVIMILIILFCLIYYLRMPAPCPRPLW